MSYGPLDWMYIYIYYAYDCAVLKPFVHFVVHADVHVFQK